MPVKIDKKIVGFAVIKPGDEGKPGPVAAPTLLERPAVLPGWTYKLKTPLSEHALYITINDVEIDGQLRPFEIFINCKDMTNFQWVVALTRVISAIFRHGGEVAFLVEELMSVMCPKGGYFYKGQYRASLVAEIGSILRDHLTRLGLFQVDMGLAVAAKVMVAEKQGDKRDEKAELAVCPKCHEAALVVMDGCLTCTACGDSKCG